MKRPFPAPAGQCQRRDHPAEGFGRVHGVAQGGVAAETGVAADQVHQVDGRHTQDGAGEAIVEAGDQRRDQTAERDAVDPYRGVGLLPADPGDQPPDVPDRLGGAVDVVEHVLTGELRAACSGPCRGVPGARR